jgi:hypothetical protein
MGALADAALAAGGQLIGILPKFMNDLEWGHKSLTELRLVDDMHHRKRMMIEESDAIVALPGGSGTFEELLEAITWKRLGLVVSPIVIVNVRGFLRPLARPAGRGHRGEVHGRAPSRDVDVRRISGDVSAPPSGPRQNGRRGERVRPARSRPSRLTQLARQCGLRPRIRADGPSRLLAAPSHGPSSIDTLDAGG